MSIMLYGCRRSGGGNTNQSLNSREYARDEHIIDVRNGTRGSRERLALDST